MSTLHAFTPAARHSEAAQPDALAKYRLAPEAIAVSHSSAGGGNVAVVAARQLWRGVVAATETLRLWQDRAQSRKSLSGLDERMLRDIGVSSTQLWHEASKPFWRD
jgi:uncharacterized protein YjiS (DUF1127 family)